MVKKITPETLAELPVMVDEVTTAPSVEHSDRWVRQSAVELALQHHKINGGMLTPDQLLANAVKFHDYITGETK